MVEWFAKIPEKKKKCFLQFDIVDFYPSISAELLRNALSFAAQHAEVSSQTVDIVMHARKSLLFDQDSTWVKKEDTLFDVTMGSYDGAEVCELVGIFLLKQLKDKFSCLQLGLYRDDGLGVGDKMPGPDMNRMMKQIIKIFQDNGLKITIEANL